MPVGNEAFFSNDFPQNCLIKDAKLALRLRIVPYKFVSEYDSIYVRLSDTSFHTFASGDQESPNYRICIMITLLDMILVNRLLRVIEPNIYNH